jgi:hypothetical protein
MLYLQLATYIKIDISKTYVCIPTPLLKRLSSLPMLTHQTRHYKFCHARTGHSYPLYCSLDSISTDQGQIFMCPLHATNIIHSSKQCFIRWEWQLTIPYTIVSFNKYTHSASHHTAIHIQWKFLYLWHHFRTRLLLPNSLFASCANTIVVRRDKEHPWFGIASPSLFWPCFTFYRNCKVLT